MPTPRFIKTIAKIAGTNNTVLLIDEVDQAGNHIDYDIKNLKLKIRPDEQHQYNSPWNIAMNYDADMSLHADGIAVYNMFISEDENELSKEGERGKVI